MRATPPNSVDAASCWRSSTSLAGQRKPAPELPGDAVLQPMGIPPFHRAHGKPLEENREVQVVSGREARRTAPAEDLPPRHRLPLLHLDRGEVAVERHEPITVIDDDGVPVDAE